MILKKILFYLIFPPLHPLLPITLFFIFGIVVGSLRVSLVNLLIIELISSSTIGILYAKNYLKSSFAYVSLLCIWIPMLGLYRYKSSIDHYYTLKRPLLLKKANYTGWVQSLEPANTNTSKYLLTLGLAQITDNENTMWKASGYLLKCYLVKKPEVTIGDSITVQDISIKPASQSLERYLLKESILAMVFITSLNYTVMQEGKNNYLSWLAKVRERVKATLQRKFSQLTATLFCSLFLGTKYIHAHYSQNIKNTCNNWGIAHYLARSGLHVTLIVTLWAFIFGLIPISYPIRYSILSIFIIVYYLLTWSSVSFIRAFVTFLLYAFCLFNNRSAHSLYIFTVTTFLVLFYNPVQLFFLDFQLSFSLAGALAWFNELQIQIRRSSSKKNRKLVP